MIGGLLVLAAACRGTGERPHAERVAGVDALVAGDGPLVVFANAATPRGIQEPAVARLVGALAMSGLTAVAPDLPRVRHGEVTPATVDALVDVIRAAGPRAALLGTSTGAGLAILAAADPRVSRWVTGVAAISPFASLRRILLLATTGVYDGRPFAASSLVGQAATRSLVASAPDDPAVAPLIANRDPARFDELYAALAPTTHAVVEELSPAARIAHVLAPVELACDPGDRFFPVDEAVALARAGRDVRLTVTPALEHVRPRLRPGLLRVAGVLDRTLRRAREAEGPAPALRPSPAL